MQSRENRLRGVDRMVPGQRGRVADRRCTPSLRVGGQADRTTVVKKPLSEAGAVWLRDAAVGPALQMVPQVAPGIRTPASPGVGGQIGQN